MRRTLCEVCGKVFIQARFSDIDLCRECNEIYHLSQNEFGLNMDDKEMSA